MEFRVEREEITMLQSGAAGKWYRVIFPLKVDVNGSNINKKHFLVFLKYLNSSVFPKSLTVFLSSLK